LHRDRILINILIFLNILIPIFGLRKTCPEVRKNVPGGTEKRARKYGKPCPEVRSNNALFHSYLWEKACLEVRSLQGRGARVSREKRARKYGAFPGSH
jgi:hypothetical protein